jgi:hypothetical protein
MSRQVHALFKGNFREIIVALLSMLVLIGLHSGYFSIFEGSNPIYFSKFANYFRGLLLNLIIIIIFLIERRLRPYREIFLFLQVFILGYFAADLLYRGFHPKLSVMYRGSPFIIALYHMDYFLLHRLYQIIPLTLMALFFFTYRHGYFANYFHRGDWNAPTDLVGKKGATWKRGTLFFLSVLFGAFFLLTVSSLFSPQGSSRLKPHGEAALLLLVPIVLYSLTAALIEESFFRGLFLPLFEKSFAQRGNIYQALLFGGIHYDAMNPQLSLVKFIIFSFLGWYWGRATKETGGIGCSFLMHSAIIVTLELRVNFFL